MSSMDGSQCPALDRDPERMAGVWCFKEKRLAVATLFEYLDDDCTIDEFLENLAGSHARRGSRNPQVRAQISGTAGVGRLRVLFDANAPAKLQRWLTGALRCRPRWDMGWQTLSQQWRVAVRGRTRWVRRSGHVRPKHSVSAEL
jgi:hypothetical protein